MAEAKKVKKALGDIIKNDSKNINFDLDNWITDFEQGFPRFIKINPEFKEHYWGQGLDNRPKIKELNQEGDAQQIEGYRLIEFFPDRDNETESYLLFGTPVELMSQISLLMNIKKMLNLSEIGEWVGYPMHEYLRAKPHTGITLKIMLTTSKQPPFSKRGRDFFSRHEVNVPCLNRAKASFNAIKEACGGAAGQLWGQWSARAYIQEDGEKSLRQMVARGSSQIKAIKNLEGFLDLTECKVKRMTTHHREKKGNDTDVKANLNLESFNVYPAWVTVINSRLIPLDNNITGRKTISGKKVLRQCRLFLYMPNEPSYWRQNMAELIKTSALSQP